MEVTREQARRDEDEGERLDRELLELLNELRVALPGVQVLFAFLLTVPFQQRFADITEFQRTTYLVALLLSAGATAFLMAPVAYHRVVFRQGDKPRLIRTATRQAIVGLALLALALSAAVLLVVDVLYESATVGVVTAGVVLVLAWLWFGVGLARRAGSSPAW
ncbi:DUF6328 family protein [Conexibacter sp. SYSU D00693]|uniref:DUF6328 family protein n=1 Tax=Conexibacter sp. SYSU D00693 TaxID=2812560 RepID=UPI00196AE760|nr:DUF6328 family protein [Conexibacter sp. SYSU D00693]